MGTMKAIVLTQHGSPEYLEWMDVERPQPQPHQVVLKMHATSINFADVKARRAPYRHFQAPFTPGFDGVGEVVECGSSVTGLSIGQRVAAYVKGGSYAEYALADAILCYPLPTEVDTLDGIGIGVAITAYNALQWAARIQPNECVLLHAATGGVGSTALQLARIFKAKAIYATVGSPHKMEACQQLKPDWVGCTRQAFSKELLERTEGKGVHVILDTIGGTVLEESLHALADFGRLVSFGHSSSESAQIPSAPLHRHNRSILGYSSGGVRKADPQRLRPTAEAIIELWRSKQLYTLRGASFPIQQAKKAHELYERRENIGKIALTF